MHTLGIEEVHDKKRFQKTDSQKHTYVEVVFVDGMFLMIKNLKHQISVCHFDNCASSWN